MHRGQGHGEKQKGVRGNRKGTCWVQDNAREKQNMATGRWEDAFPSAAGDFRYLLLPSQRREMLSFLNGTIVALDRTACSLAFFN